jgi:hypothetical protein
MADSTFHSGSTFGSEVLAGGPAHGHRGSERNAILPRRVLRRGMPLAALLARIESEPPRAAAPISLGTRIREFFAGLSPRTLVWSASAAALVILLQAGLLAGIMLKERHRQL